MSGSDAAVKLLGVARATLRTIFPPRFELRVPPFFFDLRFVAKSFADYAECDGFGKAKFTFPVFRQFSGKFEFGLTGGTRTKIWPWPSPSPSFGKPSMGGAGRIDLDQGPAGMARNWQGPKMERPPPFLAGAKP